MLLTTYPLISLPDSMPLRPLQMSHKTGPESNPCLCVERPATNRLFYLFYSCKTGVQKHIVSVHITTVGMNTGSTLCLGTKLCAGIIPELRWTATVLSGTSKDPKHKGSMTDSQLRQPKVGT